MKNECIIIVFAAITYVAVEGLSCYYCTTIITGACGDPFDYTDRDVRRLVCNTAASRQVCTKTIVYNGNNKPIEIKRGCKNKADVKVVDDATQWGNFCEADLCNRARRVDAAVAPVFVSLVLMRRDIVLF